MGIKSFNCVALLDFPNVIGPNESNSDSEMTHFMGVVTLKTIYPRFTAATVAMGTGSHMCS